MHHIILVTHSTYVCDKYQKTCPTSDKNQILKLTYKSINKTVSVLKAIITNRFLKNSINSVACRLKSLQNMSFYYFLMSRLFFREKKKGKSSSLYLTDNSKLKNLCKRLRDRHTQREKISCPKIHSKQLKRVQKKVSSSNMNLYITQDYNLLT